MTRDEAIKDIEKNILPVVGGKSLRMAIDVLKQPEIILCKECKHYDEDEDEYGYKYGWCWSWGNDCDPDGFCNYAERRTDGSDR